MGASGMGRPCWLGGSDGLALTALSSCEGCSCRFGGLGTDGDDAGGDRRIGGEWAQVRTPMAVARRLRY